MFVHSHLADPPIASSRQVRFGRHALIAAVAIAGAATLSACGDDAGAAAEVGVLTVEMADFHYGDLPEEVPAGTRLTIENTSTAELHELVAIRLPDDDDRNVEEILDGDPSALFADGPPQVAGGPPHFVHGMADELLVTG